jgi:hypothetical protein
VIGGRRLGRAPHRGPHPRPATPACENCLCTTHHKAAALLCELARNPSLEARNLLYAATVTAAYLAACGLPVSPGLDSVLPLARAARKGLPVREVAAQLKTWTT